jgi:uncharacterized membrane protein/protein-disulfide isomerase
MQESLTMGGRPGLRLASFASGLGMVAASLVTIHHFFAANYPTSIYEGSVCDINAFFNCDSSAYSVIAQIGGVPLGYFGVVVGALVVLGAVFPSPDFERTNKSIAWVNGIAVVALILFSLLYLGSLCLYCSVYWMFSLVNLTLFWKYGIDWDEKSFVARHLRPSFKHVATFAVVAVAGAWAFAEYHETKREAQTGRGAVRIVQQFYSLPRVEWPSLVSQYMVAQSTERFEDAPIRIVEFADFLCPDCLFLNQQLDQLKEEFAGKINIAFQFFPLDRQCNDVVDKDKHPGACELSYMAAHRPSRFLEIHDEIFANFHVARSREWRQDLARRYEVEAALSDSTTQALVHRLIDTGREYEKTSDEFAPGIRSTPTMIINNRLVIGTMPYELLRAIFQALVYEHERPEGEKFLEDWVS